MADRSAPRLVDAVIAVVESRAGSKWRTSGTGERWLDLRCPFHDDQHPSAGFQPETGVFHCFTCNKTIGVTELAQVLMVDRPAPPPQGGKPQLTVLSAPTQNGETVTAEYRYTFPDGTPSHLVRRLENAVTGKKRFLQCHIDGTYGLPDANWPLYEPQSIAVESYLVIVEGEKCVDAIVQATKSSVVDHPIAAITWNGGAAAAQKHAQVLARRVKELAPAWVVCWPDFDEPGLKAMTLMAQALKKEQLPCTLLDPQLLGLAPKADVVDFLAAGHSLVDLILRHRGKDQAVLDFVAAMIVLADSSFVFPQTRLPVTISAEEISAAWQTQYRQLPSTRQVRDAHSQLLARSHRRPTRAYYRLAHQDGAFYWRSTTQGKCFMVSRLGVGVADEPPDGIILLPPLEPHYPAGYEPGSVQDLIELVDFFRLDPKAVSQIEGWLCTTLLGLQTPILLIRGPAGSGKTTLAKLLLSIVEPTVPELDASVELSRNDRRELIRTLERNHAMLLDNVSMMSRSMEDTFSKLVTETTHMIRPLYEDRAVAIRMHRSLIVTTITWDMFKSDLISRTITVATSTLRQQRSDDDLTGWLKTRVDRLRGYIFSRCVEFYRHEGEGKGKLYDLRIGDFGRVLTALGYDEKVIANEVRLERSKLISQNDGWMEGIVTWWNEDRPRIIQPKALAKYLEERLNEPGTIPLNVLGRYLAEKAESFRDYGFVIDTKGRTNAGKIYHFLSVEQEQKQEELSDDQPRD